MRFLPVLVLLALIAPVLSGCSGVAKGVTEAIIESKEKNAPPPLCDIRGQEMTGVRHSLDSQAAAPGKRTKVIMVHGISRHVPGYSAQLRENMTQTLGLNTTSRSYKEIAIRRPDITDESGAPAPLGTLRVTRHTDEDGGRELLFYELTWSEITEPDKAMLAYDEGLRYRRAEVNGLVKTFFNGTVSDLMVYQGEGKPKILAAVGQAVCWAFTDGWDSLPDDGGAHYCDITGRDLAPNVARDDYFFVSHSLGSRIVVDTLAWAAYRSRDVQDFWADPEVKAVYDTLRDKEMTVFMLSNQLPLLQMGRPAPEHVGVTGRYCGAGAPETGQRVFKRLNLVAFSDPNDILSYALPPGYEDRYIDSRLCPRVMNVDLNVTGVQSAFGLAFASPASAHGGYQSNERVAQLIADGVGPREADVPTGCAWTRVVE